MSEVVADLQLASTNMRSSSVFNTVGRSHMESAVMSHAHQRSNKVDSMMNSSDAIGKSAYAGNTKKSMMQSAKDAFGYS